MVYCSCGSLSCIGVSGQRLPFIFNDVHKQHIQKRICVCFFKMGGGCTITVQVQETLSALPYLVGQEVLEFLQGLIGEWHHVKMRVTVHVSCHAANWFELFHLQECLNNWTGIAWGERWKTQLEIWNVKKQECCVCRRSEIATILVVHWVENFQNPRHSNCTLCWKRSYCNYTDIFCVFVAQRDSAVNSVLPEVTKPQTI